MRMMAMVVVVVVGAMVVEGLWPEAWAFVFRVVGTAVLCLAAGWVWSEGRRASRSASRAPAPMPESPASNLGGSPPRSAAEMAEGAAFQSRHRLSEARNRFNAGWPTEATDRALLSGVQPAPGGNGTPAPMGADPAVSLRRTLVRDPVGQVRRDNRRRYWAERQRALSCDVLLPEELRHILESAGETARRGEKWAMALVEEVSEGKGLPPLLSHSGDVCDTEQAQLAITATRDHALTRALLLAAMVETLTEENEALRARVVGQIGMAVAAQCETSDLGAIDPDETVEELVAMLGERGVFELARDRGWLEMGPNHWRWRRAPGVLPPFD